MDACPKCRYLQGRKWQDQDIFQAYLIDSVLGPIWNLDADHSEVHHGCRCTLSVTVEVDLTKIPEINDFRKLIHHE